MDNNITVKGDHFIRYFNFYKDNRISIIGLKHGQRKLVGVKKDIRSLKFYSLKSHHVSTPFKYHMKEDNQIARCNVGLV